MSGAVGRMDVGIWRVVGEAQLGVGNPRVNNPDPGRGQVEPKVLC